MALQVFPTFIAFEADRALVSGFQASCTVSSRRLLHGGLVKCTRSERDECLPTGTRSAFPEIPPAWAEHAGKKGGSTRA